MTTKQKILIAIGATVTTVVLVLGIFLLLKNSRPENDTPRGTALEFSFSSVQTHNSPDNCWISFNGQVYDLTRRLISADEQIRAAYNEICGRNVDAVPTDIKTVDALSVYQIGILSL